jgi:hypothetical protein
MSNLYNRSKNALFNAKTKVSVVALTAASLVTTQAHADLPAGATAAITAIGTDGLAIIDAIWVPLAAIVGGFIVIKLFKRGTSKI